MTDHHQPQLFGADHDRARLTDPPESHEAAKANPVGRSKARYHLLATVAMHPASTWDKLHRVSGINPPSSVSRMLTDLRRKGLIEKYGTGVTVSGSTAAKYTVTAAGMEALAK